MRSGGMYRGGVLTFCVSMVLMLVLVGCGQSNGGEDLAVGEDDRGANARTAPSRLQPDGSFDDPPVAGSGAIAAEETVRDFQESLVSGYHLGVCLELSVAAQRQVVREGGAKSCERAIATLARRNHASEVRPRLSKILAVDVRAQRAVVTMQDGSKPPFKVVLVVENGKWAVPDVDLVDPTGLPVPPGDE